VSGVVCPFGGVPGAPALLLQPLVRPPTRVFRVLSGSVWWQRIHWDWRQYVAALSVGLTAVPPSLGPRTRPGIYFTDRQSLEGLLTPTQISHRLSLYGPTAHQCYLYGCAVIEFTAPSVLLLSPPGLTAGGAREWQSSANVPMAHDMVVTYVEPDGRWYKVPI
jgi:hypothetical protein